MPVNLPPPKPAIVQRHSITTQNVKQNYKATVNKPAFSEDNDSSSSSNNSSSSPDSKSTGWYDIVKDIGLFGFISTGIFKIWERYFVKKDKKKTDDASVKVAEIDSQEKLTEFNVGILRDYINEIKKDKDNLRETFTKENSDLRDYTDKMYNRIREMEEGIKGNTSLITDLQYELNTTKDKLAVETKLNAELTVKLNAYCLQLADYQIHLEEYKKLVEKLQDEIKQLQKEIKELQNKLIEETGKSTQLLSINKILENKLNDMERQLGDMTLEKYACDRMIEDLKKQNAELSIMPNYIKTVVSETA